MAEEKRKHKDHTAAILLAVFLGWAGVDRFYLRRTSGGLVKLFLNFFAGRVLETFGVPELGFVAMAVGIGWWLVDFILIAIRKLEPLGSEYA